MVIAIYMFFSQENQRVSEEHRFTIDIQNVVAIQFPKGDQDIDYNVQ